MQLINHFTNHLKADNLETNHVRLVKNACFSFVNPTPTKKPKMIHLNEDFLRSFDMEKEDYHSQDFLKLMTGNTLPKDAKPYAMCYGGHQFGHWAGQLGDGRAINLGEILKNNEAWTVQLKGAGKTPYSRKGDGLAVLRSSIREYLCSEAMHYLGIPTTRVFSLALTGDEVLRDMLYDGNANYEKGAIVSRVAPSFLRFGSFQIHAANQETDLLKQLLDYVIINHYQHLGQPSKEVYIAFVDELAKKTIDLVVEWERVGFVHGVLNTDNLSILGLTIDFGPYGWVEDYNRDWTPNTSDSEHRYAFGEQINVAFWNIYQLLNALYPAIEEAEPLQKVMDDLPNYYDQKRKEMFGRKLGLEAELVKPLINPLIGNLENSQLDMTLFFRQLISFDGDFEEYLPLLKSSSYVKNFDPYIANWKTWFEDYQHTKNTSNIDNHLGMMRLANPKYIFRNYMAQLAIEAAEKDDFSLVNTFFILLKNPYDEQPEYEQWFAKRPDWALNKVGCSALSCSS
jgi:uncharacterized protein YdiU (UPF0061 family)